MLKIRFQRAGRKNDPAFRIVVTESTNSTKTGNHVDVVGSYHPKTKHTIINGESIKSWMSKGAQVSGTVHNLLVTKGIIEGKKVNVLPKKTPIVKEPEPVKEEAPKAEAPVADAPAEEPAAEEPVVEAPAEEVASKAVESTSVDSTTEEEGGSTTVDSTAEVPAEEPVAETPAPEEVPAEKPAE